mmetsp:Transcript_111888/g.316138  ORF Transcript_111888/g.316138 Transcript_111888/m.316138 type:complete len:247 (+) Transcript_111888:247-987(+)
MREERIPFLVVHREHLGRLPSLLPLRITAKRHARGWWRPQAPIAVMARAQLYGEVIAFNCAATVHAQVPKLAALAPFRLSVHLQLRPHKVNVLLGLQKLLHEFRELDSAALAVHAVLLRLRTCLLPLLTVSLTFAFIVMEKLPIGSELGSDPRLFFRLYAELRLLLGHRQFALLQRLGHDVDLVFKGCDAQLLIGELSCQRCLLDIALRHVRLQGAALLFLLCQLFCGHVEQAPLLLEDLLQLLDV